MHFGPRTGYRTAFTLTEIPEDGGALEVIRGSHKANYPLPENDELRRSLMQPQPLEAGSTIIFTHDTYHGSYNHRNYIRRGVFASFCTGMIGNSHGPDNLYHEFYEEAQEGSWRRYFLRRIDPYFETYPQQEHPFKEERVVGIGELESGG